MTTVDLVVRGGEVYVGGSLRDVTLGVTDGRISHVTDSAATLSGQRVLDVDGKQVLPGFVDTHVHLRPEDKDRGPDGEMREGVDTGTAAAAAGGVTTVVDMPNFPPTVIDVDRWNEKRRTFEGDAHVDYSFYATVSEKNLGTGAVAELAATGAPAFKTFTTASSGPGDLVVADRGRLYAAFEEVAETGRPFYVHTEDDDLHREFERRARESDATGIEEFLRSRPPILETTAVSTLVDIARETGTFTVVAHTTTAEAVDRIDRARTNGVAIHAETTPYYLAVDTERIRDLGNTGIGSPAVRDPATRKALWDRVDAGTVTTIGTDHAPRTPAERERSPIDAGLGMPQLETAVPYLLTAVEEGRTTLDRVVDLYAETPARVHGFYPRKGHLGVGADADFVVVERDAEWTVDPSAFESRAKYSPFEGRTFSARPVRTFVRGREVAVDMDATDATPGQLLTPVTASGESS